MALPPNAHKKNNAPIVLIGHSGCTLEVVHSEAGHTVVKTAKDQAYNERLEKQYLKQKTFKSPFFRTPVVFDAKKNTAGLFVFSMEYVNGFTLAEYVAYADIPLVQEIAKKFITLIPQNISPDSEARHFFYSKIQQLEQRLDTRDAAKEAMARLREHTWDICIPGACHGDLTLENIIWKDGELYLIDFLDSFYDSWMLDMSKLLFDIECLWSYRHTTVDQNTVVKLSIFKKTLLEKLYSQKDGQRIVQTLYHMALLHILRIIPYTDDAYTREYLYTSVNKLHRIIDSL